MLIIFISQHGWFLSEVFPFSSSKAPFLSTGGILPELIHACVSHLFFFFLPFVISGHFAARCGDVFSGTIWMPDFQLSHVYISDLCLIFWNSLWISCLFGFTDVALPAWERHFGFQCLLATAPLRCLGFLPPSFFLLLLLFLSSPYPHPHMTLTQISGDS